MSQPAGTEGQQQQQAAEGQQQQTQTPPWGDDANFNPEKAWSLIQNLRGDIDQLKQRPVLDDATKAKVDEFDRLKAASQTDLEKKTEEVNRWQTEAEKWRTTSVSSTIKALAAADFEYPDDAVGALDPAKYLDAGGMIDERAIQADLAQLLESRPKWRRGEGEQTTRTPRPNAAQGSGGSRTVADPASEFGAILQGALRNS